MGNITLLAASAVVAFFGWGWVRKHVVPKPVDRVRMEEQMKKEGVLKADGTIGTNTEFDAELNAMAREMNAVDADASGELDSIEQLQ